MPVVDVVLGPSEQAVATPEAARVGSIDLLRGAVMIVMALDHVRDYFHRDAFLYSPTDLARTSAVLFFTRWITHFCAPVFVLLAGVSAALYGSRRGARQLAHFLWTRGLWLVFVELFVLSLFKTFNPTYPYFNLQVIWAIGVSMMVLSALVRLEDRWILLAGLLLAAGHNLLDGVHVAGGGPGAFLWAVLHERARFVVGRTLVVVLYPLLPWVGTLCVGYSLGRLFTARYDAERRKAVLLLAGLGASGLFVILRAWNAYGDPDPWSRQGSALLDVLSFLNLTKYPPSLLYLLMTLGPALVFLSRTESVKGGLADRIAVFGRVPMFYYLCHFLLIHVLATLAASLSGFRISDMVLTTAVYDSPGLKGYGFGLPAVYAVWLAVVVALFPLCRWYDRYKRAHLATRPWLSYL